MELDAQQISILLNVPFKKEPIVLDLDAIYHPDMKLKLTLSKYPYITPNVKYSFRMMKELVNSGYGKIISFFFDKKVFQTIIYKYTRIHEQEEDEEPLRDPHKILQYNAITMLKLLFPTYHPSAQNVSYSLDEYILQKGPSPSYKILFGFNQMSYLKIDGTIYTITKTVFLNDLLNHPVYKNVIKRYIDFSLWSKKQEGSIKKDITNGFEKLKNRFQGEWSIQDYKSVFEKERQKYESFASPMPMRQMSKIEDDKRMFVDTVGTLMSMLTDLYAEQTEEMKKEELVEIHKTVNSFYESMNNIKELYTRIVGYNLLSKTPVEFSNRINRLLEESKKLMHISKIWNSYIKPRNINVRIEDENPELLSIMRSKYKPYIDYVDVIRTIIRPSLETSNLELQECINNYSQNRVGGVNFTDVLQQVHDTYMYVLGEQSTMNGSSMYIPEDTLMRYMDVGVSMINADEQNKPRYEINVAMNLIENMYTTETIGSIKCIYDGFVLGKELENTLNRVNPYETELDTIYVSQADIESQKEKTDSESQAQLESNELPKPKTEEPSPVENKVQFVGGKKTRTRRKSRRKTRRNRRKV